MSSGSKDFAFSSIDVNKSSSHSCEDWLELKSQRKMMKVYLKVGFYSFCSLIAGCSECRTRNSARQ